MMTLVMFQHLLNEFERDDNVFIVKNVLAYAQVVRNNNMLNCIPFLNNYYYFAKWSCLNHVFQL